MLYVFGRGFEVRSDDDTEDATIQEFLTLNEGVLGHVAIAQLETSIQTDGALYFGCETLLDGTVRLNMIEPLEIMDIVTREDDRSVPRYFYRQWEQEVFDPAKGRTIVPKKCWYPAIEEVIDENAEPVPAMIVQTQVNVNMPILRVKVGSPRFWRWGLPPIYALIDWGIGVYPLYGRWATVQRAWARIAILIETKGGPGAIAAYNALFSSTLADNGGAPERNPPPNVASAHISGPGNTIQAFKSANAQTSPEQARRMLLMLCAGAGMPETFFGDASTGSLATAVSLDRPTELKFHRDSATLDGDNQNLDPIRAFRSHANGRIEDAGSPASEPGAATERGDRQKFPNVVEHDILQMIQAIVDIGTGGGRQGIFAGIVDRRTLADLLLTEIGMEKRGELLEKISRRRRVRSSSGRN